jgi:malonyl-CoA decarboxylase
VTSRDRGREEPLLEVLRTTSRALLAVNREPSSRALADLVVLRYRALDAPSRLEYLRFLASELGPDPREVRAAVEAWQAVNSDDTLWALARAVEAPRQSLFRAISTATQGVQAVIDLRRDVLSSLREHPEIASVERDLHHVLSSWFGRGLLDLQRIRWESPARVLEKVIAYEAVHEIKGWGDLRRRLEPDRRCYGFFHPTMPYEPLIFVEVALMEGMASTIDEVLQAPSLGDDPPGAADTAVFYSITSCQPGLSGIPLGDFLIKQVVEDLAREHRDLQHFVTLSPIPGFRAWLDHSTRRRLLPTEDTDPLSRLADPNWHLEAEVAARLRPVLEHLCAVYLLTNRETGARSR